MKLIVKTKKSYKLDLTPEEAKWLKSIMQNPLVDNNNPDSEEPEDKEYRETMFYALDEAGVR